VLDAAPRILTSSEVFAEAFAEHEALVDRVKAEGHTALVRRSANNFFPHPSHRFDTLKSRLTTPRQSPLPGRQAMLVDFAVLRATGAGAARLSCCLGRWIVDCGRGAIDW
jgi:hypothetical protein